uniref:Phosphoglycerate kinase n=1 Tax=Pinus massoniana TaxID=88730 RepID=A0A8K1JUC2_PINMS|nr:phosphoglycerate kinase 1 [Pinus massoniana]
MASTTAAAAALGRIASTPNLQAVSSSSTSSPVARLAIGSRSWSASPHRRLRSIASSPLLEVKSRFGLGAASNLFASENDLASAVAAQVGGANNGRGCRGVVSMAKRSVGDLKESDLKGKKVFVRADLNVPLDENQNITDDTRIRAAVPTIKYLISNGAKVILTSHLGRPKGVTPKYSLKPLVPRLTELLGVNVVKADDCVGPEVEKAVASLPNGGVLLLENVRFYKEEEKNDPEFAKKLASIADLYVNDAFGTAHRAHASTEGVTKYLKPAVAGFLLQKELDYLVGAVSIPKRPFAAIVGGSKVSSKIGVIESLLEKVDILLLGGGMIFTFYKAQGLKVGSSLVEDDKIELAKTLMQKAKEKGVSLLLPTDVVIADKFAADANSKVVPASDIPDGWMGLDIGADSIKTFSEALDTTKTVIWNGPMGVFEFDKFAAGTESIAKKLAELSGKGVITIIGGGDSVAAVEKVGVAEKMSHISTGGGASLELLEGKTLPGVLALDEAVPVTV